MALKPVRTLNRPYAFAMASTSALFLALVGLLGQSATRELSVFSALFMRYLASTFIVLIVLRGTALQTLRKISRLDYLRVGSALISQFCLFYYLAHGSLLVGMLLYNTGPFVQPIAGALASRNHVWMVRRYQYPARVRGRYLGAKSFRRRMNAIVLVALASGFFNSCSQLAFHRMSRDEGSPLESLFPFYVLLTVCSIAPLPFVSEQTILAFERLGRWDTLALVIGLGFSVCLINSRIACLPEGSKSR